MVLIPHQVLNCDVPDYEDQSRTYALRMRSSERYRCPKVCMERFALVFVVCWKESEYTWETNLIKRFD